MPGLKEGMIFSNTKYCRSSFWVAADPSCAIFDDKPAKSSQLYSPSASHRRNDFFQNGVDDLLNVTVVEMRILSCSSQYKF